MSWGVEHFADPLAIYEMDAERRRVFIGWKRAEATAAKRRNRAGIPATGVEFASDDARRRSAAGWVK